MCVCTSTSFTMRACCAHTNTHSCTQASQGSYSVDPGSPLYHAKLKLQDAVSINPSDPSACYHLGRLCLLLGEREAALQYLTAALALRPTHSPTRLCLGLVLPPSANVHTKQLLVHGLSQYLAMVQESHETQAEPNKTTSKDLHGRSFYHSANTLVVRKQFLVIFLCSLPLYLTTLNHCYRWTLFFGWQNWVAMPTSPLPHAFFV